MESTPEAFAPPDTGASSWHCPRARRSTRLHQHPSRTSSSKALARRRRLDQTGHAGCASSGTDGTDGLLEARATTDSSTKGPCPAVDGVIRRSIVRRHLPSGTFDERRLGTWNRPASQAAATEEHPVDERRDTVEEADRESDHSYLSSMCHQAQGKGWLEVRASGRSFLLFHCRRPNREARAPCHGKGTAEAPLATKQSSDPGKLPIGTIRTFDDLSPEGRFEPRGDTSDGHGRPRRTEAATRERSDEVPNGHATTGRRGPGRTTGPKQTLQDDRHQALPTRRRDSGGTSVSRRPRPSEGPAPRNAASRCVSSYLDYGTRSPGGEADE
jgi:hypothetical protein